MKKKLLVKDIESALVDESIQQLNDSCVPVYYNNFVVDPPPVVESNLNLVCLSSGSLYIKRIDLALNFPGPISGANTFIGILRCATGDWSGTSNWEIVRQGFAINQVPGSSIIGLGSLIGDLTNFGNFPLIISAPAQIKILVNSFEVAPMYFNVTMWCRPTEYEIKLSPNYYNKLRNFFVYK